MRRKPGIIVAIYSSYLNAQGCDIACVRCSFGRTRRNYVVVVVSRPAQDLAEPRAPPPPPGGHKCPPSFFLLSTGWPSKLLDFEKGSLVVILATAPKRRLYCTCLSQWPVGEKRQPELLHIASINTDRSLARLLYCSFFFLFFLWVRSSAPGCRTLHTVTLMVSCSMR